MSAVATLASLITSGAFAANFFVNATNTGDLDNQAWQMVNGVVPAHAYTGYDPLHLGVHAPYANVTNYCNASGVPTINFPGPSDIVVYDSRIQFVYGTPGLNSDMAIGGIVVSNVNPAVWTNISPNVSLDAGNMLPFGFGLEYVLTIGSGGIDLSHATAGLSFDADPMIFGADQTWSIGSGQSLQFNITNAGTAHITVTGPGSLALGVVGSFGSGPVTFGGDVQLKRQNVPYATGGVFIYNTVSLNGDIGVWQNGADGGNSEFGTYAFGGGLDVGAGTHQISLYATPYAATNMAVNPAVYIRSPVTGTGTLVLSNGCDLVAHPVASVQFASPGALVSANLTVKSGVEIYASGNNLFSNTCKLQLDSGSVFEMSTPNYAAASGWGSVTYDQTVGALTGAGLITSHATSGFGSQNNDGILTVDDSVTGVDSVFSGNITDNAEGVIGLTKAGSHKLTLSGTNTYNGPTTVDGGTLLVNGTIGQGVGTNHQNKLTVSSGAALGGTGSIQCTTALINGKIAPGIGSIGTLNIAGTVTWEGAATASSVTDWAFKLGAGNISNRLNITGDFNNGTNSVYEFDFGGSTQTGTFTIVTWTGTSGFNGTEFSATNIGGGNTATFARVGNSLQATIGTSLPSTPTNISCSVSGSTMTVGWPSSYIGWILQVQTNSLAGTWHDIPGSASVNSLGITINSASKAVFYRLAHP